MEMARKKYMRENKETNKIYAFLVSENLMWNLEFGSFKCVLLHFWCNCDSSQESCQINDNDYDMMMNMKQMMKMIMMMMMKG